MCNKGITQLYLLHTRKPYLPLLPSRKASPPFGWYSLRPPRRGGQAELTWVADWLVAYRDKCPAPGIEPGHGHTVTHPSTDRAPRRLLGNVVDLDQLARQTTNHKGKVSTTIVVVGAQRPAACR